MNALKIVTAAGLLAATAACTQTGHDNSYAYNGGYNNRSPYYSSNTAYRSGYYNQGYYGSQSGNPFYSRSADAAQRRPYGDMDRDGVRNRNDIDANGDGIPDAFQR
ncbi:MAG: hypothetical protein IBJ17_04895 [Reyranella sp.]|jgi:hypothetical protein|nr:hypothetical protein [Reyranella sp.]